MSASPEKKAQTKAERDEKRRMDEQKDRRSMAVYTAVAVLVVAAAAALMIWNSGLLQRGLTALEVNGTKYSAADVQYYYNNIYSAYAQSFLFNTGVSPKKQVYDEAAGQSWHDYFLSLAEETLTSDTALAQQAQKEGYTLSAEGQADLDSFIAQLDTLWIGRYSNRDSFIKANFGSYMTYDRLITLVKQESLAGDYANAKLEAMEHSDSDYQAYYKEHTEELDTITYTLFTFRAQVPVTDADGNAIELTEAEKSAQLETLKAEQKALAEEVKSKLEGGADPEELSEEYGDKIYSTSLSSAATGSSLSSSVYGEWIIDSARKEGDINLSERDAGTSFYYYVVRFEGRALVQDHTNDVRHLLVRAGDGNADPTQAEYDAAEEKAQSLLDQWKAGEATEDSFAQLVTDNTDDTASKSTGGLYTHITETSSYVEEFRDWATDPARRMGDTGLVKTEFGWHVMYYIEGEPVWKLTTAAALREQDYENLTAEAAQGWNISRGMGMSLVGA
ncbi:peptidylprolyl isomerase [Oscillospiraceae bacterium 44-34]